MRLGKLFSLAANIDCIALLPSLGDSLRNVQGEIELLQNVLSCGEVQIR